MTDIPDLGSGPRACGPSCRSPAAGAAPDEALAILCTLGAGDLRDRTARIRDLAARHLCDSRRDGLTLRLIYDPAARAEVEEIVAQERECCAFLTFELRHDGDAVRLAIIAPEAAGEGAAELFAHFAPGLAG